MSAVVSFAETPHPEVGRELQLNSGRSQVTAKGRTFCIFWAPASRKAAENAQIETKESIALSLTD